MEKKKKLIPFMVIVLLIGGIPAALGIWVAGDSETVKLWCQDASNPEAAPVLYPDGQKYVELNDTYAVGDSFTVWLNVTDVTNLRLYGVGVTWDDSILSLDSYEEGEFFYRAPAIYRTLVVNLPMLAEGTGHLGKWASVSWALKKPGNVTGTGTLAVFDFTVVNWGVTKIDVVLTGAEGAVLQDNLDNDIDFNTYAIMFDNTGLVEEHELSVSVEAPNWLLLGESSLLNATVENLGLTDETDVEFKLMINGTVKNSTTITDLLVGSSYTIDYMWTPTTEATYNITAYATPVTGETITVNNVATKLVLVRSDYWCIVHSVVWDDVTYYIRTCSNGSVSDLTFSQPDKRIIFDFVAPPYGETGVYECNVTIPKALLNAPSDRWVVRADGVSITARIVSSNDTHTFIYFTTEVGEFSRVMDVTGTIVIPEFPTAMLPLLFMIATLVIVTLRKINKPNKKH